MTGAPILNIDAEAQRALDKAMKVLQMAQRQKGNEKEAAVAAAKFQELLVKYNLDQADIEQASGIQSGKREEQKLKGGQYEHQRQLWAWAAELNFCLYWTLSDWDKQTFRRRSWDGTMIEDRRWKNVSKHKLVGRTVNVAAAIALASYLEEAIERVTMDELHNDNRMRFSNYAVSMRKGMTARLVEKMRDRRQEMVAEEQRIREEAEEAARRAARAGVSTSTAVSLESFAKSEKDANQDFLYGEGWSAEQARERAERAEEQRRAEAAYARWAAANPEEARKKAEEEEAELQKRQRRYRGGGEDRDNVNYSAYYRGYDKAQDIGLDQQMGTRTAGKLGHD